MDVVAVTIFLHRQVASKNQLFTQLIDHLSANKPKHTDELTVTLSELTWFNLVEKS